MGFLSCVMYSNRIRCPLSKISVKAYISEDIVTTRTHALVKHIASPTPASQSFSFNDDKLNNSEHSSLPSGALRYDIVEENINAHQSLEPEKLRLWLKLTNCARVLGCVDLPKWTQMDQNCDPNEPKWQFKYKIIAIQSLL